MSENMQAIMGLVRHVLGFAGGWIVAQGYASQEQTTAIIGGVAAIIAVVWSALQKKKKVSG